jgi:predicted DNA-binding mobile mystery protein A
MSVKNVVLQHYRNLANHAADQANFGVPPEGWLRTVRRALGMSGAQLAEKMGVTRARVAQVEHDELAGAVTLKSMRAAAKAMGCRFVYAVVPETTIEDVINSQARRKAYALANTANTHMALESQNLPDDKIAVEVERLAHELAREMPSDFWKDEWSGK